MLQNEFALSNDERERLALYESHVELGFESLMRIKEERLWREYESFEQYFAARWNEISLRRRNQKLAAFRVFAVLQTELGTAVPLNATEYGLRPLVKLTDTHPQQAVEVYGYAIELANGHAPTHDDVVLAKQMMLSPEEIVRKNAIDQINGMRFYNDLVKEIENGGDPKWILGLAVALESCETKVRRVIRHFNVRDIALIRKLNESYVQGRETADEVLETGYLQFEEYSIRLDQATAKDYQRLLDNHYREHLAEQRDSKRGQAVSVVIFNGDAQGTYESLKQVLDYVTLIGLSNLLSLA